MLLAALVVELGGGWNTTTVNELTVVPSEDVESCSRGLHINGALVRPLQRGTLVRAWRSLMTAAGVASELLYLFLHLRLHRLSLWADVQKQGGARERQRSAHKGMVASGAEGSRPWIGARCARSEVGEDRHHQPSGEPPSGGLGRARVSLDWSAAVRALETAESSAPTSEAVVGRGKRHFSAVLQAGGESTCNTLRGLEERFVEKNGGPARDYEDTTPEQLSALAARLATDTVFSPLGKRAMKLMTFQDQIFVGGELTTKSAAGPRDFEQWRKR